jgi:hypothetical protein
LIQEEGFNYRTATTHHQLLALQPQKDDDGMMKWMASRFL